MRGAFRIGSVGGIQIRVHYSFLLILPFLGWLFARRFTAAADAAGVPQSAVSGSPYLWGLGLAIALFLGVLVHELAHAFYALAKGGQVRGITLLMIGGVSELTEPPKRLKDEAIMALVGPATSIALGILFFVLLRVVDGVASFNLRFALFYLAQINVVLGIFNLLPAFPMDGGRIVRALLASRMGMARGTRVAATLGKVFAALFAIVGLFTFNFVLLFISYFIFLGAESEARQVLVKAALGKVRIRDLMTANVAAVDAADPVTRVGERMIDARRLTLPVLEDGQVIGMAQLRDVQAVPPEARAEVTARQFARPAPVLSPDEDVWKAVREMEQSGLTQLPVVEGGQLIGVLRREDVARGLALQELDESLHPRQPTPPPSWPYPPNREVPV